VCVCVWVCVMMDVCVMIYKVYQCVCVCV